LIQEKPLVSIITPISGFDVDLSNLKYWLEQTPNLPIKTIIIHDQVDQSLQSRLEEMLEELNNPLASLYNGNFGSPGAARNKGLEFVTTKRVVFWDADDIGEPHNLIQVIKDHEDSKVIVGSYTINSDSKFFDKHTNALNNDHTLEIQLGLSPGIWRYIFNYAVIKDKKFSNAKMGEDQQFLIEIQAIPEMLTATKTILYNYFTGNDTHLTAQKSAKGTIVYTFNSIQRYFIKRNQRLNLFETTIFMKLMWSSIKYGKRNTSFNAVFAFLYLIFFLRKISFRNLAKIVIFLNYKEG
jgi:glycosyltransferase involved in cell wall biosynthesis